MKHFQIFMCLCGVVLFAACTSEPTIDEPVLEETTDMEVEAPGQLEEVEETLTVNGVVDVEILNNYKNAVSGATYKFTTWQLFNKDELTNGEWEEENLSDLMGAWYTGPNAIVVRDGKLWNPVQLFNPSTGPTAFYTALKAINLKLKKEYSVYAARPFEVDVDNRTLAIDGTVFTIAQADEDLLVLSYISEYVGGRTHNGGLWLEYGFYSKSAPLSFDNGKDLGFDSVVEAYDWLIDNFTHTFGDSVNLNPLLAPYVRLDNPMFYLSELKAERNVIAKSNK